MLSDTSKVYVPPSCKSKVTALAPNVAVSPEFLNLYLFPLSLTTTTLYVCVGAVPPANQLQAQILFQLPLTPVWSPTVKPSVPKAVTPLL